MCVKVKAPPVCGKFLSLKIALDVADEQREGTIYIIPLLIEKCEVPDRLRGWQWVELNNLNKLFPALDSRFESLNKI